MLSSTCALSQCAAARIHRGSLRGGGNPRRKLFQSHQEALVVGQRLQLHRQKKTISAPAQIHNIQRPNTAICTVCNATHPFDCSADALQNTSHNGAQLSKRVHAPLMKTIAVVKRMHLLHERFQALDVAKRATRNKFGHLNNRRQALRNICLVRRKCRRIRVRKIDVGDNQFQLSRPLMGFARWIETRFHDETSVNSPGNQQNSAVMKARHAQVGQEVKP